MWALILLLVVANASSTNMTAIILLQTASNSYTFAAANTNGNVRSMAPFPKVIQPSLSPQSAISSSGTVWMPAYRGNGPKYGSFAEFNINANMSLIQTVSYTPPGSLLWMTIINGNRIGAVYATDFHFTTAVYAIIELPYGKVSIMSNFSFGGILFHSTPPCTIESSLYFSYASGASGPYYIATIDSLSGNFSSHQIQYLSYGYGLMGLATTNNALYALVFDYNDHLIEIDPTSGNSKVVGPAWANVAGSDKFILGDSAGNILALSYSPQTIRGANVVSKKLIEPSTLALPSSAFVISLVAIM